MAQSLEANLLPQPSILATRNSQLLINEFGNFIAVSKEGKDIEGKILPLDPIIPCIFK